jgi:hypothetical protein
MNIKIPSNWNKLVDAARAKKIPGIEIRIETAPAGYYTEDSEYMIIGKEFIWTTASDSLKQSSVDHLLGTIKRLLIKDYSITEFSKVLKLTSIFPPSSVFFKEETELERYIEAIIFSIEEDSKLLQEVKEVFKKNNIFNNFQYDITQFLLFDRMVIVNYVDLFQLPHATFELHNCYLDYYIPVL